MSRSGYIDDFDENWSLIRWRGQVASATRGKRGQRLFRDLLAALDAMPEKALITGDLETKEGDVCALGSLGKARGIDMATIDPEDPPQVGAAFDIADQLAQEIVYMNDGYFDDEWDDSMKRSVPMSPERRWEKMRDWVSKQIKAEAVA